MTAPLMPKATAVWLIENTTLTFDQIAAFCALHPLEVQTIADEEGQKITGQSPIQARLVTQDEINKAQADTSYRMQAIKTDLPEPRQRSKGPRYTPISKRQDKPDAIAWLLKHHPELNDNMIGRLVGTTRGTIQSVRDKTHPNSGNFQPRSPVELGLCTYQEFDKLVQKARKQAEKEGRWKPPVEETETAEEPKSKDSGFDFTNFLRGTGS
ncbi:MAG: DUF1013 domain-containing protein [Rhodospirillales bacterium]|nr:DUF1013 domain-containing protein [Alphaproteobacteria bacterium]MCB9987662.1 DUF1013 domain-containing protein [Rhodospirillales bacterium]USO08039.1 MAG: DUF1013 domain-containing protein [Rhodospirillales bacterium]